MRQFTTLLMCLVVIFGIVTSNVIIPQNQVIKSVTYEINLQLNHEVQIALINVKNEAKVDSNYFIHVIHSSVADKIAFVKAYSVDQTDSSIRATRFIPDFIANPNLPRNHIYYKIPYPTPLLPNESIELFVRSGFHKTQVPFPQSIPQNGKQRMLYTGFTSFFSMYPVLEYSTTVYTQSSNIDSWTPRRNAEKRDKSIVYSKTIVTAPKPFETGEELTIHAQNHSPFYSFSEAKRYFDLSYNGDVTVTENYFVEHIGAKLSGPFHRSLHDRTQYEINRGSAQPGSEVIGFSAFLPHNTQNIDFRDFNGNISTSRIIHDKDATVVDLQLRFPLYGGWKSDFELGYTYFEPTLAPSSSSSNDDKNQVVFTLPFGYPFNDATGDIIEIIVLLPEGAENIEWKIPFDIESVSTKVITSFKDTIGRTQVTFKTSNVIPNMWDSIAMMYTLPKGSVLLQGPPRFVYFIAGAFFIVLIFAFGNFGFGEYKIENDTTSSVVQANDLTENNNKADVNKATKNDGSTTTTTTTTTTPTPVEEDTGSKLTKRAAKSTTKK